MNLPPLKTVLLSGIIASRLFAADAPASRNVTSADIIADAEKMADAQLVALNGKTDTDWIWATMYAGYAEFAQLSSKPDEYLNAVAAMGEKCQWAPLMHPKTPFHADDYAIGQTILAYNAAKPVPAHLIPLKERLDALVTRIETTAADPKTLTWSWCDALFMAPPVLSRFSAVSGDRKYIDAMDKEWWKVADALYDKDEHLWYRDNRFLGKTTKNGKKVFWARGNGWVAMGLARVLQYMPQDYPSRQRYVTMLRDMAATLATHQSADGSWHTSLLDPEELPNSEASGTVFFTYAMAWGMNHGLLNKEQLLPVVAKGWTAVLAMRRPDGILGFVQGVSDRPGLSLTERTQLYATGGALLAATELQKLAPLTLPAIPLPTEIQHAPPPGSIVVPAPDAKAFVRFVPERMDDIAWENDRIAHRLYGPALEKHEATGSGIDIWVKSTPHMVVNKFYQSKDYHHDHGQGLDCYSVGESRGCGGLGIWANGNLFVSRVWKEYKILENGPETAAFQLIYAPWEAAGREVSETRVIKLVANSNLNRMESTISSPAPGDLVVAVGIGIHKDPGHLLQDKESGFMSYWEPAGEGAQKNGMIGCAVVFEPAQFAGFAKAPHDNLVLLKVTPGKPFVYYAGAGWSKSGNFATEEDWVKYLKAFKGKF